MIGRSTRRIVSGDCAVASLRELGRNVDRRNFVRLGGFRHRGSIANRRRIEIGSFGNTGAHPTAVSYHQSEEESVVGAADPVPSASGIRCDDRRASGFR